MARFGFHSGFALAAATTLIVACAPSSRVGSGDDDDDDGHGIDAGGFVDAGGGFIDGGGFPMADAGAQGACDKIDVLFVIDNSNSMAEEQTNLAVNFPMFAQIVESYMTSAGHTLDYHLAVTTTDKSYSVTTAGFDPFLSVGNDGKFLTGANCAFPAGRRYLQRGDANVSSIFACVANVGIAGDGREMPLETARLALVDRMQDGYNAGFLRADALLAIVLLTDEDDCSTAETMFDNPTHLFNCTGTYLEPPASYATKFDAIKGGERARWATAVLAGLTNCMSNLGDAVQATRLLEYTQAVGTNQVFSSICEGDLAGPLADAFSTFGVACENIPGPP